MQRIKALLTDITTLKVDGIVNAANNSLLGGGGVDGAIHRAAGPRLLEACKKLDGCPTGEAKLTPGFQLPSKYIIHTVGPVYKGGSDNESRLLQACYQNSLEIASQKKFQSLAFPGISTGVYGYPLFEASEIAFNTVKKFLDHHEFPAEIIFACFSKEALEIYQKFLKESS